MNTTHVKFKGAVIEVHDCEDNGIREINFEFDYTQPNVKNDEQLFAFIKDSFARAAESYIDAIKTANG